MNAQAEKLKPWKLHEQMEGGSIYTAENDNRFFVIEDQSTLVALLSDEDAKGIEPIIVLEFDTLAAREVFMRKKYGCAK